MFAQGKNGNKQCTPDVYRGVKPTSKLQLISFEINCDNEGMIIDFRA